ncbi:MAG: rRNA pseudouridine synthase [Eggerthellaceae bacterium]|nr:rRNA pseudouridine synthase [Eggerthellaceae bacterium]
MDDAIRLNRFLARCGLGSRRGCEDLIRAGRVSVNGVVASDLSVKVFAGKDIVMVDGELVSLPDETITIMLHKPSGYVTTMSDPQGRPCVASLVPIDAHPSLFPVGRLDFDTTGLLLFTTDGKLGHALLHPRHHVRKSYYALVDGMPSLKELASLREGIQLDDGMTQPCEVELLEGTAREEALALMGAAEVERAFDEGCADGRISSKSFKDAALVFVAIREGRKRQVKRMLSAIGHPVISLHRPSFGPLLLGDLPRGFWRSITNEESALLYETIAHEDGFRG